MCEDIQVCQVHCFKGAQQLRPALGQETKRKAMKTILPTFSKLEMEPQPPVRAGWAEHTAAGTLEAGDLPAADDKWTKISHRI